jgi:hypothetical protein
MWAKLQNKSPVQFFYCLALLYEFRDYVAKNPVNL